MKYLWKHEGKFLLQICYQAKIIYFMKKIS